MATDPAIVERDKRAEKGRVRRLKVKVMKLLNRPRVEWGTLVGPDWIEHLEHVKTLHEKTKNLHKDLPNYDSCTA